MSEESAALNRAARAAWETNAAAWDAKMGDEGNDFQRLLVGPATERLLAIRPGERVLEVACGNGLFARRLARLGAKVTACDFSAALIERARVRTAAGGERVDYRVADATDKAQLLGLGEAGSFDAAACNMALMDMAEIEPLYAALAELLRPGGRFVFSVMHPCFNTSATTFLAEWEDREGTPVTTMAVKVTGYLNLKPAKGLAIAEQPEPHYYFHRPLQALLGAAFAAGFVLDGLEERSFEAAQRTPGKLLNWTNYQEIPAVMVARVVKRGA
jgi:2-polyprenyl-3-methyl-5-hydroxy-6-metoxy-1,4-benzoquinol methylase